MNCRILSMLFLFIIHSTVFSQSKKDKKKKLVADTITELKAYQEGDIGNIQEDSELENTNYVVQNNCPTCKENLIRFEKTVSGNTKYGYKTKYDQVIIPAVFDVADYRFNSTYDYSVVGIGELKGIINHMGDFLVPLKYQYIQSLKDDLFTVTNNSGKKGIIDIKNKEILSMVYDEIYTRGENLLILKSRDMCSLRSLNDMKIIIQGNYDDIKIQDDKLSIIGYKKNDKKFWYEWPSLNLIDTSYTKINMIQNGNYLVCKKNKYGIVNVKNEVIVPIIYDDLFINWEQPSLFTAKLNGKMGVNNR
jgi:hypothetical protein